MADTNVQKHWESSSKFSTVSTHSINTLLLSPILTECQKQKSVKLGDIGVGCNESIEQPEEISRNFLCAVASQLIPCSDALLCVDKCNISLLNSAKASAQDDVIDSCFSEPSEKKRRFKTVCSYEARVSSSSACTALSASASSDQQITPMCNMANEVIIKSALSHADSQLQDLIGNFTGPYCLPTVRSAKHQDLKAISSDTVRKSLTSSW
jgi:hypothetical protein